MPVEHRVFGPPGCGKTTYLSRQVNLAVERVGSSGVMIASLTRAAAAEVKGRGLDLPREAIGTLHAHAYRALDRPKLAETPEGLQAWNAWLEDHGELASWQIDPGAASSLDYVPSEQGATNRQGEELLSALQTLRARRTPEALWQDLGGEKLLRFAERWEAFKTSEARMDFTDLIEEALASVHRAPGSPRIMLLDEAQDLSRIELDLARRWADACEQIVVVGDPWQSLYAWRGTDPEAMVEGEAASERVLEQSWRVPAAVHEYAVAWLNEGPQPLTVEYKPRLLDPENPSKGPAPGEVAYCPHPFREPEGVITRVEEDLAAGKTVMILASCGYMLDPAIATLKQRGIPFFNPYRTTHGGWNPLRGANRLLAYLRPDEETWDEEARAWTWDEVRRWIEPLRAAGRLSRGAKTLVEQKVSENPDLEATIPEVLALFSTPEMAAQAVTPDVEWWRESLLDKPKKMMRYPLSVYDRRGGAALRQTPKVVLGTIHSVKGGQADSVYVFPDLSKRGYFASWDNPTTRAPSYRLFYVAFTRAREKLTVCAHAGFHARLPKP